MRGIFKNSPGFTKVEFWAFTTIFAFAIFFFIVEGLSVDENVTLQHTPYQGYFAAAKVPFHFYYNYFIPELVNHLFLFCYVMYLNFVLVPALLARKNLVRDIFLLLLAVALLGVVHGITNTYLKAYLFAENRGRDEIDQALFGDGFEKALLITWMIAIYTAIKHALIYLVGISEKIGSKYRFLKKEAIIAFAIWIVGLFMLRFGRADLEFIYGWIIVIPSAIALYLFSFHRLIPAVLNKKKPVFSYLLRCCGLLFFAFIVVYLFFALPTGEDDAGLGYSVFNSFFQLFITAPVSWVVYKRQLKGNETINILQKELKQSTASIDFLRSQINPHFLFNALNTLYGTAIQENADKTSEGIQRLGDMMRFMLQENMQEKISLAREIEYLNNYISLQKLRTDGNPTVQIQTEIQDTQNLLQIAPMLLIPFVENAFKHGISFREPSHIKITLEVKDSSIYFDVYNSKHIRAEHDPEKDKSGIGLENVSQRLKLSYPGTHELNTRETTREFFVHLTIQLSKFA